MNAIGLRIDNLWDELNDLRESAEPDTFKLYHMLGVIHGLKEAEEEYISLQAKMEDAYAQISYIKEAYRAD